MRKADRHGIIITTTGAKTRVYTGSSHWRHNAFVFNVEQQLVIERPELVAEYTTFFQRMWEHGLPSGSMPLLDVEAVHGKLN